MRRPAFGLVCLFLVLATGRGSIVVGQESPAVSSVHAGVHPGDRLFQAYLQRRTEALRDACLQDIETLEEWQQRRPEYRRQLLDMLGLDPLPPRTDLKAKVTAVTEHPGVRVERIHFQSSPGLYVTGNLYLPVQSSLEGDSTPTSNRLDAARRPAILYLCGHGQVKIDGVSYGNKVHYQHHGIWYARNGYICLVIDSLQLGEIEGIHHGTHRYDMWWWLRRGYTPAGVEAWNCMRAIDYLQSRPDVDSQRLGVTGRSGGGAYSWWIAALDDRVQVAVPVAGITDLENHVIDGCVDGHCDCMYFVNTYGWDYPLVAALVAPRPLLISNTDRDSIFPLEGVVRTHAKVRRIYELYGVPENLALHITAGPHEDTQELQIHAFRWFNQHLKQTREPITIAAQRLFEPKQLQVFLNHELPVDARNATIHEQFVAAAEPKWPATIGEWEEMRAEWIRQLTTRVFTAWPQDPEPLRIVENSWRQEETFTRGQMTFASEDPFRLPLVLMQANELPDQTPVELRLLDEAQWTKWHPLFEEQTDGTDASERLSLSRELLDECRRLERRVALFAPRGIGPTATEPSSAAQVRLRRRLYLLGQTQDAQQAWDVRRAIQALRSWQRTAGLTIHVTADDRLSSAALFASLFESHLGSLTLSGLRPGANERPVLLNMARYLDLPQAMAMALERQPITLRNSPRDEWEELIRVTALFGPAVQPLAFE